MSRTGGPTPTSLDPGSMPPPGPTTAGRRRHFPHPSGRSLLVAPTAVWWLLLFAAPLVLLVVYSFGEMNAITFKISFNWTTENYRSITQSLYLHTIVRSIVLSVASTVACFIVGFPTAYFVSLQRGRIQVACLTLVLLPFWCSFIVRTYAWTDILQNGGPIERVIRGVGIGSGSLNVLYTPTSIAIGMVYNYLPLMVVPLFVALDRIDPSLLEAASDLGATGRRRLSRVILPLSAPGIIAGCILVGVPALGEYVIPAILGGNKTLMFGNVVADQFLQIGDYPFGAALATSFVVCVTLLLVASRGFLRRAEDIV